jgi:hypothetical protein
VRIVLKLLKPSEMIEIAFLMLLLNEQHNKGTTFIVAGNLYGSEVETPRNDASTGLILLSDAKGEIKAVPPEESTLHIKGEMKSIRKIKLASANDALLLAIK